MIEDDDSADDSPKRGRRPLPRAPNLIRLTLRLDLNDAIERRVYEEYAESSRQQELLRDFVKFGWSHRRLLTGEGFDLEEATKNPTMVNFMRDMVVFENNQRKSISQANGAADTRVPTKAKREPRTVKPESTSLPKSEGKDDMPDWYRQAAEEKMRSEKIRPEDSTKSGSDSNSSGEVAAIPPSLAS